jgi:hypothetical protein
MNFKVPPTIITPFSREKLSELQTHVNEVRKLFDAPGIRYHDWNEQPNLPAMDKDGKVRPGVFIGHKFNRWFWHRAPVFEKIHHSAEFLKLAKNVFGREVKPSYSFVSMYGPEGVCPIHTDRPPCQFTIDIQLKSDNPWPIYVEENEYLLKDGNALCYSGTGQPHYRKPMSMTPEDKRVTYMNLVFFHFVPIEWQGGLD